MNVELSKLLESHFVEAQNLCSAPELAYGVTFAGELVAAKNTATPFRIASMTKSFTAAAVLVLRDRGLLKLDQPVEELVPELASLLLPTADSPDVTVRHLLTMSSGLAYDDPWGDRLLDIDSNAMQELLTMGASFATAPGTKFVYSSYGYAMLGQVVTNVAGVSYQQFINSELLAPLGMKSTTWDVPANSNYAAPFRLRNEVVVADDAPQGDGGFGAMGGLWSTVDDVLKWANFLMDAFPARDDDDSGPLKRSSCREMQQVWRSSGRESIKMIDEERIMWAGYGMGLKLLDDEQLGMLTAHSGGLPGYGSNMSWHPQTGMAIVSLANITYAPMWRVNLEAIELMRRGELLPEEWTFPTDKIDAPARALVDLLNNWNDQVADELFAHNVSYDDSYEDRQATLAKLKGNGLLQIQKLKARDAVTAEATLVTAEGAPLELSFSLSSRFPPQIQAYSLDSAM